MKTYVSKSQFKPRALHWFREVEQTGTEVVITDRGKPVLKLVPYSEDPAKRLTRLRGSVVKYDRPLDPSEADWDTLT